MKTIKKPLSVLLFAVMLLSVICAAPFNVFAAATTHYVGSAEQLQTACETINADGGEHIIELNADISGIGAYIGIEKSGAVVTVIGNGHTLTNTQNMVYVENGATLNLGDGNSTLTFQSGYSNDEPGIISVLNNGVCNMYDGVTLKDHIGQNYFGGGVTVEDGTFRMYGGTIDNCGIDGGTMCFGGGVAVVAGGKFIMDGGTISNCYAKSDYVFENDPEHLYTALGGGVFVTGGSSFTMNGGTITGCEAKNFGGGVAIVISSNGRKKEEGAEKEVYGFGMMKSTANINSGIISSNKAKNGAGVFASGFYCAYTNRFHLDPQGVGVTDHPGLFINGGENKNVEISSNIATEKGGGVFTIGLKEENGKSQLYNARIINNKAQSGAGVENYGYWTQLDIDGCTITGNEATSNGGGISAELNSGSGQTGYTKIKDTTITNNTSGARGAGVYYDAESEIRLSGADVIQDNTYNGKKNNLNVLSLEKPVKVVGDLTGSQIGLSDPTLWDDNMEDTASEAVSTERLTDGYKANNASLVPADAFTSDHKSWYVDFGEKMTEQGAEIGRTYKYTADKYITEPEMTEGYPVANGAYIRVKAKTLTKKPVNTTEIYNELIARYSTEYELKPDLGPNVYGDEHIYYDSRTEKYITLYQNGNSVVYIWVGSLNNVLNCSFNNCDNVLISGVSFHQYGKDGELVLGVYRQNYPGSEPEVLSETDIELEYDEALDFEGEDTYEDYYLNDLGIISSKYVINKSSEVVDIQYDTVTTDYTSEVRLVRRTAPIKFHVNEPNASDRLFRVYNADDNENYGDIEDGKHSLNSKYQISAFYDIPKFAEDDYVFAGWYTVSDNSDNSSSKAFKFDSDIPASVTDVYAHWIPVGEVSKDKNDDKILPASMKDGDEYKYRGFGLFGVQIRPGWHYDSNYDESNQGGLRFIASVGEDLLSDIDAISDKTVDGNKVEYGFITAGESSVNTVANDSSFNIDKSKYKIQYKGTNVNGVNTTVRERSKNNFNYITNLDCTSKTQGRDGKVYGNNSRIKIDHRNYMNYRLATYVVKYEDDPTGANLGRNVVARAYMRYYDANGLLRTFYNDYGGTCVYGGCSISYNRAAEELKATNEKTAAE